MREVRDKAIADGGCFVRGSSRLCVERLYVRRWGLGI
jgi:hypothetical protein